MKNLSSVIKVLNLEVKNCTDRWLKLLTLYLLILILKVVKTCLTTYKNVTQDKRLELHFNTVCV